MRALLPLLVLACAVGASAGVHAQVIAQPATVLERVEPAVPLAASEAGVEGDVTFRAAIDATGRVERVDVESVPQPDLGFEEAVRRAVSRWRFAPAQLRGAPVAGDYRGTVRFSLTLPGEAMLSASSRDAWNAVRDMVRDMKIPVEKADDRTQLLTSGPVRYLALKLPDAASIGLPPGYRPDRLVLHVYVTPGRQPARVSVGTVMELGPMASTERQRFTVFGHEVLAHWFLTELARRMGVRMEPMAASAERRAVQSQLLMPPGLSDPCSTGPARLAKIAKKAGPPDPDAATAPQMLYEVKPLYPEDQRQARKTATIMFHGEITEHGTLIHPTMTEPADAPTAFVTSAQLAFGLWRFSPSHSQGCPVRVNATFQSDFKLQ